MIPPNFERLTSKAGLSVFKPLFFKLMSNDAIFYTQLASIIVYISALFVVYRVLVHQKDATIELLREKNSWLHEQLETSKALPTNFK